jgi:hypothetical protein
MSKVQNFSEYLSKRKIPFIITDDKITVCIELDTVFISNLKLPDNVTFNGIGSIWFTQMTNIPPNTSFNNVGNIFFNALKFLPKNIIFNNSGYITLFSLKGMENINFQHYFNDKYFIRIKYDNSYIYDQQFIGTEKEIIKWSDNLNQYDNFTNCVHKAFRIPLRKQFINDLLY